MRSSEKRRVFLVGSWALKTPRLRAFRRGRTANIRQAQDWRLATDVNRPNLCPVLLSVPFGLAIVMRRARELTEEEAAHLRDTDGFPDFYFSDLGDEYKASSWGYLDDGRLVLIDYGDGGTASGVADVAGSDYVIVPSQPKTELEKFASWFHQDWKLMFPNFYEGTRLYAINLPEERRKILREELLKFISANAGSSAESIKKSWLGLGAQGWQADLDIRAALGDFADMLK